MGRYGVGVPLTAISGVQGGEPAIKPAPAAASAQWAPAASEPGSISSRRGLTSCRKKDVGVDGQEAANYVDVPMCLLGRLGKEVRAASNVSALAIAAERKRERGPGSSYKYLLPRVARHYCA